MPESPKVIEAPALVIATSNEPRSKESVSPTTTAEEDLHTKAARLNDSIWEITQSLIAVSVTGASLYVLVNLSLIKSETALNALNLTFGLVIGFYFGRTNHARLGGVNKKPD